MTEETKNFNYYGITLNVIDNANGTVDIIEPAFNTNISNESKQENVISYVQSLDDKARQSKLCKEVKSKNYIPEIVQKIFENGAKLINEKINRSLVNFIEKHKEEIISKTKKGLAIATVLGASLVATPELFASETISKNIVPEETKIEYQYSNPFYRSYDDLENKMTVFESYSDGEWQKAGFATLTDFEIEILYGNQQSQIIENDVEENEQESIIETETSGTEVEFSIFITPEPEPERNIEPENTQKPSVDNNLEVETNSFSISETTINTTVEQSPEQININTKNYFENEIEQSKIKNREVNEKKSMQTINENTNTDELQNQDENIQGSSPDILSPVEFLSQKINASGVSIHLSKEQMKEILKAGKNVQRMAVKYGTNQDLQQENENSFNGYGTYVVSVNEENARQLGIKIASQKYGGTFYINNEPFNDFLQEKSFSPYWSNLLNHYKGNSIDELTQEIFRADVKGNASLQKEQSALTTLLSLDLIEYKREQTFLYSVDIPDNDNTNYLLYNNPIGIENATKINNELEKMGVNWRVSRNDIGKNIYFDVLSKNVFSGNQKSASEFLKNLGYVGMQMDNSNYIVFNDKDMNITDRVQFMKDDNGEIYGFAFEGEIYADEDLVNSNVLAHEYTHIWDKYVQNNNPDLWQKGKDILKGTSLWQEIVEDENYENLKTDDEILSECHARIVGKMAEQILENIEKRDGGLTKKRVIDWDKEVSQYIAEELLIKPELGDENYISDSVKAEYLQQFLSMPMKDLMNEVKVNNENKINEIMSDGNSIDNFKKELSEYLINGKRPENDRFIIGKTPKIMQNLGQDNTAITIPISVIKKAVDVHNLTQGEIENAVEQFYNPVLIFDSDKSTTENKEPSQLVLTDVFKDEKPLALAVNINSTLDINNRGLTIEVQDIRSIHDRTVIAKNGTDLIEKWANNGLCRYVDDKKITDWSTVARVYFPIELLQSDNSNILSKSELVKQQLENKPQKMAISNNNNKETSVNKKQKVDVSTYRFQSGETIEEIVKNQTSFNTEEGCLLNIIDSNMRSVEDFITESEKEVFKKISVALNLPETDLKELAIQTDVAARFLSAKHYNSELQNEGKRPFSSEIENIKAQEEFPYELPSWMKNELETASQNNEENQNIKSDFDKDVESLDVNGGLSEAAMEADYNASLQENQNIEEEPEEIFDLFYDSNGNPHYPQEVVSMLENFQQTEQEKWNVQNEEKTAVFRLIQKSEIEKGDFENSVAKLREYLNSEEYKREEENYAKIFTPILLTNVGQDYDAETKTFGKDKFSYKFSTDDLKPEIPIVKGEIKSILDNDFSGKNIELTKNFQNELIQKGIVKAEEKFVLVNENEATAHGTKIKENQPYVVLTIPVTNGDKVNFVPTKYYHVSALEEPQKIEKQAENEQKEISKADEKKIVLGKTKILEFATITQKGLESFKDMIVDSYEESSNTYLLKSEDGKNNIRVTENTLKTLASDEYSKQAENYTQDTKTAEKMIETQYNDYFKPRSNCANNFRHNLSVFCRKEANSPLDALKIANHIISEMPKDEKRKTKELLNLLRKDGQTINDVLVETYFEAVKEVPLNEGYLKNQRYDKMIARPMYDTLSAKGEKIDRDFDLKIGDSVDVAFKVNKAAKTHSLRKEIIYQNCTIISSSKENNMVTLMDGNKSFYDVPRDTFLAEYGKQQHKAYKMEHKVHRQQSMQIEIGR